MLQAIRQRRRRRLVVCPLACAALSAAIWTAGLAWASDIRAPRSVNIGDPVEVRATGLKSGFFYRATLDQTMASKRRGIECARNIDRTIRVGSSTRTYVFRGRVPSTLGCRDTRSRGRVYPIRLRPGSYRWVIGRKTGVAAWDRRASLIVQRVQVSP